MKKQITKVMLVMVLLTSGFLANANEKEREISLKSANSKSVVLQMNHVKIGSEVTLWSESGELLFKDQVKQNTYSKVFNLNQLEEGQLILELESQESLEVLPISVTEDNAEFIKNEEKLYAKPVVRLEDDLMKIFLKENHRGFEMKITDQLGQSVIKHQIEENSKGLKRYDVSKLSSGKYNIQFTADGRSFYHTIIIE
ncbi:MAG TPA: T9SS type A sorting domain-containing protein [Roseivirga sp.]